MTKDYSQIVSDDVIAKTVAGLESKGFNVMVAGDRTEAVDKVKELIAKGSEVFTGTSVTLDELGLSEVINNSTDYVSARAKFAPLASNPETKLQARQLGSASDYAIGSAHAITEDGKVLIASNSGSQLPNYVYGANHVVWVVGAQKLVKDLDEALDRINSYTLPLEDKRAQKAYGVGSMASKIVIFQADPQKRINIVIIKDSIGY